MSLAVGLDASELRMGWAVVDYDTQEPLVWGVEDLRERDGGYAEEQVLRAMKAVYHRIWGLMGDCDDVFVVGIEDAYMGPSIKGTIRHAGIIGMATMAVRCVFGPVQLWPIPNGTWLNPLGIKPASRKKADVKPATMAWAQSRLIESFDGPGTLAIEQDAADALGIATACALLTIPKATA